MDLSRANTVCTSLITASLATLTILQLAKAFKPAHGPPETANPPTRSGAPSLSASTSTTAIPENSSPYTGTRQVMSWAPPRHDKAGVITDLTLCTTLPYGLSIGGAGASTAGLGQTISTCEVYHSPTLAKLIFKKIKETRLSGTKDIYHSDIVDLILNKGGSRIYVYGGYVRDLIVGKDADDVDFLFRSSGGSVVPFVEQIAKERGWSPYR